MASIEKGVFIELLRFLDEFKMLEKMCDLIRFKKTVNSYVSIDNVIYPVHFNEGRKIREYLKTNQRLSTYGDDFINKNWDKITNTAIMMFLQEGGKQ